MESFANREGAGIVYDMIKAIQVNKQYLSDIDGAIGDGDHGINMNKGFTLCETEIIKSPGDLSYSLKVLSRVLMADIGGSMGPLYGVFFRTMASMCSGKEIIDGMLFGEMLAAGGNAIREIGSAEVGDKTLLDSLVPAEKAFNESIKAGKSFADALMDMKTAAVEGRDSTKDMVARVGRASRLGERSKGVLDAGAASCCMILQSMAESVSKIL